MEWLLLKILGEQPCPEKMFGRDMVGGVKKTSLDWQVINMIIKSSIKLGGKSYVFEADEKDEMESLHRAIVLASPRKVCNECGNDDPDLLGFTTNKDKEGNIYVNVKCYAELEGGGVCEARSKLGQYKNGGYFWHDFERYVPPKKKAKQEPPADEPY